MKLLFVTDNGFAHDNGSFYFSAPNAAHIHHLEAFFTEFVIIARNDHREHGYIQISSNYEIHLVEKKNIINLKKLLKNKVQECDAVMCYGANGYFASCAGEKAGKIVISYNGGDPYDFCMSRGNLKGKLLAPVARYMCKKSFQNSDFGHYCDEFLFDRYPAKGEMLACSGVDIICDEQVLNCRLKKIYEYEHNQKYKLGLIGHTKNSLKGIDIAIQALSDLGDNYSLEIVGRGNYEKYIQLAESLGCQNRVKFIGALAAGNELFSWIDTLDIYIQPSRIEGLPRATIESMSRACPVVASDAGALLKLIDSEFVFPVQQPEKLVELIINISNKSTMINQAKRNFDKSKKYEASEREKKYAAFYTKVIEAINRNNEENNKSAK